MSDFASLAGTLLGASALMGGHLLEGGRLGQVFQFSSALIVVGGTVGATLTAFPPSDIGRALGMIPRVYGDSDVDDLRPMIEEILKVATVARKDGLLALEPQRATIRNEFFKRSLKYVIEGYEPQAVREILEAEIEMEYEREVSAAQVFESAGGYAPAIGILGAALGLIQVMAMLNEPSKIGEGIAVAFVSTLYGIGLANLLLLPWANKLKRKALQRMTQRELILQGVVGIQEGQSPQALRERLMAFVDSQLRSRKPLEVAAQ